MKGVVVEIDNAKCIVLFNNGNIGSLPKPPNCEVGMLITVSFNRKIMLLPIAGLIVLLTVGLALWFALCVQNISPERFCKRPFLRKDIILPLSEYADYDALFAHLGNPVREFSPDHPDQFEKKRKHNDDNDNDNDDDDDDDHFYDYPEYAGSRNRVNGFNYRYYSIITYYSQDNGKVHISEIILNSKEAAYNGNFSIGDDRAKIESIFGKYITKNNYSFSSHGRDMRFTMNNKVLVIKFNGRNQLAGIRIIM
ncbi:MAG: DUF3826 domain-containing protein [Spirochaetaceae bacterium]|nr:DUF3826 domain-containing protein [Spirochaetaceae bacterium]